MFLLPNFCVVFCGGGGGGGGRLRAPAQDHNVDVELAYVVNDGRDVEVRSAAQALSVDLEYLIAEADEAVSLGGRVVADAAHEHARTLAARCVAAAVVARQAEAEQLVAIVARQLEQEQLRIYNCVVDMQSFKLKRRTLFCFVFYPIETPTFV